MDEAKALRDKGFSLRSIATMLNTSKTSVHRMLQQWTEPPMPGAQASRLPVDEDEYDNVDEYDIDAGEPPMPGTQASRLPADVGTRAPCPPVDVDELDDEDLNRWGDVIDDDEWRNSRGIISDGEPEKHSFSANRAAEPQEISAEESPEELEIGNPELITGRKEPSLSQLTINNSQWTIEDELRDPQPAFRATPVPPELAHLATPLEMNRDYLGDEIWVEDFDEDGKPKVWYRYNGKEFLRYSRDRLGGISGRAMQVKIDSS